MTLSLPMDRAEALLCPPPGSPLRRPGAQGLLEAGPETWERAAGIVRAAAEAAAAAPRDLRRGAAARGAARIAA